MATFRKVHTQFWSDLFIQSLSPEKKYFYIYLLTNEKTRQCGIYEISTRQISFDTGYNVETVLVLLQYFVEQGKIFVSRETNEIAIKNWNRYNGSRSPDVKSLVDKEVKLIKNKKLIEWLQSVDTVLPQSKSSLRQEEEENKKKNRIEEERPAMTQTNFLEYKEKLRNDRIFIEPLFSTKIKEQDFDKWVNSYHIHIAGEGKINKDYAEYRRHFKNWINKQDCTNPPQLLSPLENMRSKSGSPTLTVIKHNE